MKVTMIGLGYIGLPNALLHAKAGNEVVGFDIKKETVDRLNRGELPFEEPGLPELFETARANFRATTVMEHSDVYVIAVPTPLDPEMKMADLRAVKAATESILTVLREGDMVVLESTVPPGTSGNLVLPILRRNGIRRFFYAHCPERAIPGQTIREMVENDRIIGGIDEPSVERAKEMYSRFVKGNLFVTDATTAEYVKLMENTYRDVNIALANEFALIAEDIGVNVWEAISLANKHPRVDILKPGPGVGGHCIAVDPLFMMAKTANAKVIPLAREINDSMAFHVVKIAKRMLHGIEAPTITVLGMAYKGNVDDHRESPSFRIEKIAQNEGISVRIHDPLVGEVHGNIRDLEMAIEDTDLLVLATDHDDFKAIDPRKLLVRHKKLIDARNVLDHERWRKAGFEVSVLGTGQGNC